MNIPELSTTLANMNLQNQVGVAVLSKALDSTEQSGTSLINMMDQIGVICESECWQQL